MNGANLQAQEIRENPKISGYIKTHRGAAKEINAAIEILAPKPDATSAVLKLLPALADKRVNVFFSYKKKDESAATAVVQALRKFAADKLNIVYQAEFTEKIAGKKWRDKIRREVRRANWFILLLPDPSDDWDWCLYETGIFDREPTSADRLICLHHPDTKIPSPIEDHHAVPATKTEVERFLRMVYLKPDPIPGMPPINPSIEDDIPDIAAEIVEAISPPRQSIVHEAFEPVIRLRVENARDLRNRDELDGALVLEANAQALDLFDFIEKPRTWGDLRSGVADADGDDRWREELFHVLRKVANKRKFTPIQAAFNTQKNKTYRPVLHAIDRSGKRGPIQSYYLSFTEEVGVLDTAAMPEEVSTLATLLRMTFRFRWELLEKYGRKKISEDDIQRITNALNKMEVDSESRGLVDEEAILRIFGPKDARRVSEMFAHWAELRDREEGKGVLDIALAEKDTEKTAELLNELIPMSQEFLGLAADRFSALISKYH